MNLEDLNRLAVLGDAEAIRSSDPISLNKLALEAHRLEDEPVEPLEDAAAIRALLAS